eukprot:4212403-Lingulodinium_polyedra.AAC.1
MATARGRPYQASGLWSLANRTRWHLAPALLRASSRRWAELPGRSKAATAVGSSGRASCTSV